MNRGTGQGPTRRVALLRGINLGGNRTIPMAGLRDLARRLGWTDVATHLQSGNLLFTAAAGDEEAAAQLVRAVRGEFGIDVDVVIRTGAQLRALLDAHPYADGDPSRVVVACADGPVGELAARRLNELASGGERVQVADTGTDVYAHFPEGQAASKLAAGLLAALRPVTGTARNLRTLTRIVELLDAGASGR